MWPATVRRSLWQMLMVVVVRARAHAGGILACVEDTGPAFRRQYRDALLRRASADLAEDVAASRPPSATLPRPLPRVYAGSEVTTVKQLTLRVPDEVDEQLRATFWATRAEHRLSFNAWLTQLVQQALDASTSQSPTA